MPASNLIDQLSFYTNFASPRDTRADQEQGARDGERNFPPHDHVGLSPYELDIVSQGCSDLARFRSAIANERNACASFAARQKQMRLEQYESERRDISSRYDQDMEALNYRLGPASRMAQTQEFALFEAEQAHENIARSEQREPQIHFVAPRLLWLSPYVWLLLLLAVAELTINRAIFEGLMRTSAVQAYGLAILFGVTVVALAHFLGVLVRQRKRIAAPWKRFGAHLAIPVIAIVVLALFYEMSVIRQVQFMREGFQEVGGGMKALLPDLMAKGAGRTAATAVDIGSELTTTALHLSSPFQALSVGGLTLLLINLVAFMAGFLLSYFRHDPHPQFEGLANARQAIRKKVADRQNDYDQQVALLAEDFRRLHGNLAARSDRLQREIEQEQIHLDTLQHRIETETDKVLNVINQRVVSYQLGNSVTRTEAPPSYFGTASMPLVRKLLVNGEGEIMVDIERPRMHPLATSIFDSH